MQCPNCATALTMSERQGVEIDYCQSCRGVWLDRGELDKIIERAAPVPPPPSAPDPYARPGGHDARFGHRHAYPHKRRKSFLEELFD